MSQQLISANELNTATIPTFAGLYTTGNVGINTNSPAVALDVVGTTRTTIANGSTFIARSGNSSAYTTYTLGRTSDEIYISVAGVANNFITGSVAGDFTLNNNTGNLLFGHGSSPALYINGSNYVGISQISPGSLLHIGNVQQQKYVITSSSNHIEFFKDATPSYAAAIGLDAPAAGSLNSALLFSTYNGSSWSESMRIDSSGRLGLNVIPSNWYQFYSAFQIGSGSVNSYSTSNNYQVELTSNAYGSGAGSYSYINTSTAGAGRYQVANGFHIWYTAGAGTAGSTASFNESMRINTSGYLGIGITSVTNPLTVKGSGTANFSYSYGYGASNYGLVIPDSVSSNNNLFLSNAFGSATLSSGSYYYGAGLYHTDGTASAQIQLSNSGTVQFYTNSGLTAGSTYTPTLRATLDTSGNLGLGVTPSGWTAPFNAIQLGTYGQYIAGQTNTVDMKLGVNNYYNGITGSGYVYTTTGAAAQINISANTGYQWYIASSNTAGTNVAFSTLMVLNTSGYLGIGTTSPSYVLDVSGTARTTGTTYIGQSIGLGNPSSSSIFTNAYAVFNGTGGNYLAMGQIAAGGAHWIQSAYQTPSTATYSILLNPLGGNIGIGTLTPASQLSVAYSLPTGGSIPGNISSWLPSSAVFGVAGSTSGAAVGLGMTTTGGYLNSLAPGVSWQNMYYNASSQYWSYSGNINMTLNTSGYLGIATTSPTTYLDVNKDSITYSYGAYVRFGRNCTGTAQAVVSVEQAGSSSSEDFNLAAQSSSYTNSSTPGWGQFRILTPNAARSSIYNHATFQATGGNINQYFRGDGNAYAHASWNSSGVDYAEYFESTDNSVIPIGTTVVLVNDKVRASTPSDSPQDILGIVRPKTMSKGPSVIGGGAQMAWQGKYLTDDFGQYIMEPYSAYEWDEEVTDADGNVTTKHHDYIFDRIPEGVTVPPTATQKTTFADGTPFLREKLNPEYDPNKPYEARELRPEWHIIGLLGQVPMLKGQPVGDRWRKMKTISDTVEMWLIK